MASNIIVKAGAGTGKTWTITEGVHRQLYNPRTTVPSEEQQAVWDAMQEDPYPCPIHMTSFTTDASDQLADRCPKDFMGKSAVGSSSTYGMGLAFAKRAGQAGYVDIWGHKYRTLTTEYFGKTKYEMKDDKPGLWDAVAETQKYARLSLKRQVTSGEWKGLADHFGISWEPGWVDDAIEGTNAVLKAGLEQTGKYDFTDMVYIPTLTGLVKKKYQTLVVDEFQDMGRAQQELCLMAGWRMILIGDPHQAIYGFAGADQSAFDRLEKWLRMTAKGLKVLPLLMTRRCSQRVTAEANKFVPELRCLPDAPEGEVHRCSKGNFYSDHLPKLLNGYKLTNTKDLPFMVICPTNAPLISLMFKLQKRGVRAYVHGKDVTATMVNMVEKADTISDLLWTVRAKLDKLNSRTISRSSEVQIDTMEALEDLCKECTSKDQVMSSLKNMFSDDPRQGWLRLSSIHRAKGLEKHTIVLWERDRCKSRFSNKPWMHLQDRNLEYVGITRAAHTLIGVDSR